MNNNFVFMAFAKGQVSTDSVVMPKYVGVAPVTVLAVNPNKAKLEELYGRTMDNEPEYITEVEADGKKYQSVRINFIVKTDTEKCNGIDLITGITFFIQKRYRQGSQSGKYQIIDKYGRTAWATIEEINNKLVPTYSTGNKAAIDPNYRPLYAGEEELVKFLINYLGIPATFKKTSEGLYITKSPEELKECEASLEKIEQYFKGDISEIKNIIKIQPENKVKVMFGVRSADDKQYQAIYTRETLKSGATNYDKIAKSLKDAKDNGAFADTEFEACDIKKYVVNATTFEDNSNVSDDPFAGF